MERPGAMQDRGHGRLDRIGALGESNLKRVRRTVPPHSLTLSERGGI